MFKIGQKVVCVNNSRVEDDLNINQIYTITVVARRCSCGYCVSVNNIPETYLSGNVVPFGGDVICYNCDVMYKYADHKVKTERFRWLLAFLFTMSILLGVIEGDRRYRVRFEIYQKVYRDRAHKKINLLIEDLKYAVYNKEMGVR